MKLVSMKAPKRTKSDMKKEMAMPYYDGEKYPYGLGLTFQKEQVDKMPGLKKLSVGEMVTIHGKGKVTQVRQSENNHGSDSYTVEIQIQDVAVSQEKKKTEMNMDEYKVSRGKVKE